MNWRRKGVGAVAVGDRGIYKIDTVDPRTYRLLGTGHDGLPMLAIRPFGDHFATFDLAKKYAERLDAIVHGEPQASGC